MQKIILVLLAGIGIAAIVSIDRWQLNKWRAEKTAELKTTAQMCRIRLEDSVMTRINTLEALASLFKLHPDTKPEEFAHFSALLLKFNPPIRALQFADAKTLIKYVYPPEGNEITVRNPMLLLADSRRGPFTRKAIDTKKPTVQGLYELRQGGTGIVVRIPIFDADKFIGLAIGVYDIPDLIGEAVIGINIDHFNLRIADKEGYVFWGLEQPPEGYDRMSVRVADTEWTLDLGWKSKLSPPSSPARLLIWFFGSGFLLSTLLLVRFLWSRSYELKHLVKNRTNDLVAINKRLTDEISVRKKAEKELQHAKEFSENLINSANVIFVQLDSAGNVVRLNEKTESLTGYRLAELQGKNWFEVLVPRDRYPDVWEEFNRLTRNGKVPRIFENPIFTKSGEDRQIIWENSVLRDGDGILGTISFGMDITDRKHAEDALRESENRYRQLLDVLPVGVAVHIDGKVVFTNPAGAELLGATSSEELIGRTITSIVHPEGLRAAGERIQKMLAGEKGLYPVEDRFVRLDGTVIPVEVVAAPLTYQGKPAVQVVVSDISARKQVEEEFRSLNNELLAVNRIITTTTTTTTTTTGVTGILESVLDEALTITDLEGGTICLATPDDTLQLAVHRATSEAVIQDLTTNTIKIGDCLCGECARGRMPLILPDREAALKFGTREALRGEDIRFHAAFPLLAAEKCLGVLCIFTRTDTKPSERKLKLIETVSSQIALAVENAQLYEQTIQHAATLENTIRERTEALGKNQKALMNVVEDLNEKSGALLAANEKLKDLDRLKNIFLASMSHELRTPLNSIIGFTGILLMGLTGTLNDEQKNQLAMVKTSANHLLELINDILDISKIEAGMMKPMPGEFHLVEVIREVLASVAVTASGKGLKLEHEVPEDVVLFSDRRRFAQILMNLLSNAVKFTEKGSVRLKAHVIADFGPRIAELKREDKPSEIQNLKPKIQISVIDTGIGIKKEDMDRLFFPFQQVDESLTKKYEGTGLGLYLSKKLANLLGGDITFKSEYGKGSEFTVVVPTRIDD
ncbi:MAG: PAS domain S-box protein [Thermodesulfobacteriota bacterium]